MVFLCQAGVHETSIHGQLYDAKCADWRQVSQQLRTKAAQNVREARTDFRRQPNDLRTRKRLAEALRCRTTLNILIGVLEIEIDLLIIRDDADEFLAKFERRRKFLYDHFSARLALTSSTRERSKRSSSLPSRSQHSMRVTRSSSTHNMLTFSTADDGQRSPYQIRLMSPTELNAKRSMLTAKLQRLYQDSALSDLRPMPARKIRQSEDIILY